MVVLVFTMLAAPPPLLEVADAGAMAWLHAPRAGDSLAKLERNGFADLARALAPDHVRRALAKARGTELAMTVYRGKDWERPDITLWLEAGSAAPASVALMERWLEGRGPGERSQHNGVALHTRQSASGSVTVFQSGGRCGWSTNPARAQRAITRAETPLAEDAALRRLRDRTRDADLRGHIDVQRLYGTLARSPQGPRIAGLVRRLGLDGLRAIEVHARLAGKRRIEGEAFLSLPSPWRDLPAALGPAVEPVRPPVVPPGASWVRGSVKPAELWYVAEKLVGFERALEASLVRAQLDAVERRLNKSFTEDALGRGPRVWTAWAAADGVALVAEVADAALAAALLGAYAEVLPTLFPDLAVTQATVAGRPYLSLSLRGRPLVGLGFTDSAIVVASSRAQLERAIKVRGGRARSLGETKVLAHGEGRGLPGGLAALFPAAASGRLAAFLARWQLRAVDNGLLIDASVTGRR